MHARLAVWRHVGRENHPQDTRGRQRRGRVDNDVRVLRRRSAQVIPPEAGQETPRLVAGRDESGRLVRPPRRDEIGHRHASSRRRRRIPRRVSRHSRQRMRPVRRPGRVPQMIEEGDEVSSAPRFTPSSLNCTPATPTLSDAVADDGDGRCPIQSRRPQVQTSRSSVQPHPVCPILTRGTRRSSAPAPRDRTGRSTPRR